MKPKIFILFFVLFLLNSCIVKSLHPFYTQNTIYFDQRFIGVWKDDKNNKCEVFPFQKKFLEVLNKQKVSELNAAELEEYNKYKDAYYVIMSESNKEALFSVFSFKIEDEVFLDFTPMFSDMDKINNLYANHLMGMHTLVKMEFTKDNSAVNLKFFGQDKLKELIDQKRINIRHEKIGHNENNYLLTASSRELQKFIMKYMNSDEEDKWATEIQYDFKNTPN